MATAEGQRTPLDDFLNPKSMLTPGLAGALTMLVTNAMANQFGLKPNYTGLVISFLFGTVIFRSGVRTRWYERLVYYGLNSLVIFSVAMGANQTGVAVARATDPHPSQVAAESEKPDLAFFASWVDGTVG